MVYHKRKKKTRMRGSHTHGGGAKKKRRGAGHRGGRGNAGSGKRADQRKPVYWKDLDYFKGPAFKTRYLKLESISISGLEMQFATMVKKGMIKQEGKTFLVDLSGYKLLSQGKPTRAYTITVEKATAGAKEKIEKAGGTLNINITEA